METEKTIKRRNSLPQRINILVIIKILEETRSPKRFSEISRLANIRLKKGLLKYLKYCTDKELLCHTKIKDRNQSIYEITENGRTFLKIMGEEEIRHHEKIPYIQLNP